MESRERKAVRLVLEGRVSIGHRNDVTLEGTVVGDSGLTYKVTIGPDGDSCECQWATHHPESRCAHARALALKERVIERSKRA